MKPRHTLSSLLILVLLGLGAAAQAPDPDTDGDGISDFREIHKHLTDPLKADTDGDGVPDGDWNERREYTYTIRTIVQVLPPVGIEAINDDYQDARLLEDTGDYVELEVVHYPFNTVADAIVADLDWRRSAKKMQRWVKPGLTSNYDARMQRKMTRALKRDGIDVDELTDKELVERAAPWLLKHAEYVDGFTTFCTWFPDGKTPAIYPGLEESADRGTDEKRLTLEEQWDRELFSKGMFEHGRRGSCTSSAIYLNGCMRALGIPSRIILTIPVVDPSDERELEMLKKRIKHHRARRTIEAGLGGKKGSWCSHTYNEVFVGGRWRRLNYDRLGQNILDDGFFGLMTHINTVSDWADAEMPKTWGLRQGTDRRWDDPFGGPNPYSAVSVSDRFGEHSKIENEAVQEMTEAVIDEVTWTDSDRLSKKLRKSFAQNRDRPVLMLHVKNYDDWDSFNRFTQRVDSRFYLEAKGHPTLKVGTSTGGFTMKKSGKKHCWAILHLGGGDWRDLATGVKYTLRARNSREPFRWTLAKPFRVSRKKK